MRFSEGRQGMLLIYNEDATTSSEREAGLPIGFIVQYTVPQTMTVTQSWRRPAEKVAA